MPWSTAGCDLLGPDLATFILGVFPAQPYYTRLTLCFSPAGEGGEWVLSRVNVALFRADPPAADGDTPRGAVDAATATARAFGLPDAVCMYYGHCRTGRCRDDAWAGTLCLEKSSFACDVAQLMERLLKCPTTMWEGCLATPVVPFSHLLDAVAAAAVPAGCTYTDRATLRTTCDANGPRIVVWTAEFEGECDADTAAKCRADIEQVFHSHVAHARDHPLAAAFNLHWTTPNQGEPGLFRMEAVIIPL
jgi:hypothetical protein